MPEHRQPRATARSSARASAGAGRVVLTGFMGTGKSTVGRLLAARLGYEFVDTDTEIEASHGPIAQIFERLGEPAFREIERSVARRLATRDRVVVATGGGLMLDAAAAEVLGAGAIVLCLTATSDTIISRVLADGSGIERPLLATDDPRARIDALLAVRSERYRAFEQIATDGHSPEEIAAELEARIIARRPSGRA